MPPQKQRQLSQWERSLYEDFWEGCRNALLWQERTSHLAARMLRSRLIPGRWHKTAESALEKRGEGDGSAIL
ncbi:MAG: hypothetical protein ACJ8BW_03165 [Ktedonobacteraceae bacterium]